jgi:hypothetical protein
MKIFWHCRVNKKVAGNGNIFIASLTLFLLAVGVMMCNEKGLEETVIYLGKKSIRNMKGILLDE